MPTTDLTMLLASTILLAALVAGKGLAMWMYWPVATVLGNRDDTPPLPAWAWRADRAHRNLLEKIPHFAVLVLLAYVGGLSNRQTALGATIFFWARVAHAALYIGGLWQLRWIAYFAGVGGELLILGRLI